MAKGKQRRNPGSSESKTVIRDVIDYLGERNGLEKKTYTEKQVSEFLKAQISKCAESIKGDNLSQYTARKKIYEAEIVKI